MITKFKIYENFTKKTYYDFDIVEFFGQFKELFNNSSDENFINKLNILIDNNNYKNLTFNTLFEKIIKNIFINKEVEFFDLGGDINSGRVKDIKIIIYHNNPNYSPLSFFLKIELYDDILMNVDYSKPVKIYGVKSEIEKIVEILSATNKYNL